MLNLKYFFNGFFSIIFFLVFVYNFIVVLLFLALLIKNYRFDNKF